MLTPHEQSSAEEDRVVFLLDVDNTLFDNDRFAADLSARLDLGFGTAAREHYWALYDKLREQLGYADYLDTLQMFRGGLEHDPELLQMSAFLLDYPFERNLYPAALDVIQHLGRHGLPVVLSDGDVVFQPRKIQRSGIWDAVGGRVLILRHKQDALEAMQQRYAARHYVVVDDKPQILAAMKLAMSDKLTTVFVRQGHYALESAGTSVVPPPDLSIVSIAELIDVLSLHFEAAVADTACGASSRSTP